MRFCLRFCLSAAIAICLTAGAWVAAQEQPRVDALGDPLPDNAVMRLGSLRFRHPGTVYELVLSPDERTIVSVGDKAIAWDAATGKQLWSVDMSEHGARINGVAYGQRLIAFAPDGKRAYLPMGLNLVMGIDAAAGTFDVDSTAIRFAPTFALPGHGRFEPHAIDVSPDGNRLAIGGRGGLLVCDLTGNVEFEIPNKPAAPVQVDDMNNDRLLFGGDYSCGWYSPDGKLLAIVASEAPREIRLIDAATGEDVRRITLTEKVVRLAFSPDGKRIAATERNPPKQPDAAVRLYNIATGEEVWAHVVKLDNPYENYTCAIAFAPDGRTIAACATDNIIYLLDAATGDEAGRLAGTNWYPWALAFTRDSRTLYSSGWDGVVRRWDVAARKQLPLPVGVRGTSAVAISPDGAHVAYQDDGGVIHLVDVEDGAELRTMTVAEASYDDLAFSPDGKQLAGGGACGDDVHVALWDAASGELARRWDWPKGRDPHSTADSLCFTPDGRRLAAIVFRQDVVKSWDVESGELIAENEHDEVFGAAYSPDGETLATVGWDSTIRLWDAATGELVQEMKVEKAEEAEAQNVGQWMANEDLRMYDVAFSPWDGTLATTHMNNELRIWNAADLSLRKVLNSRTMFSQGDVEFSPDGQWLCAGLNNGAVEVWDASAGDAAWKLGGHQDSHTTVDFSGDGRRLLTGGSDGVGYLWELRPPNAAVTMTSKSLLHILLTNDGKDADDAYFAFWVLDARQAEMLPLLAARLRAVDSLLDPAAAESDDETDVDRERTARLKRLLLTKDESVLSPAAAHRALALLRHMGTPEARALLEELAAKNPEGEFSQMAARALR
jgi:WD40 repeat protein